jgi:hypothetical protein
MVWAGCTKTAYLKDVMTMKTAIFILVGTLFCVLLAGCYTMLQHPATSATMTEGYSRRHCSDCHGSADYYYWHYPYAFNWSWDSRYYRSYYYDPWWWNDYWYCCDDDNGGGGTPVERGERHLFQQIERPTGGTEGTPKIIESEIKGSGTPGSDAGSVGGDKPAEQVQPKKETTGRHLWRPVERPKKQDEPKAKKEKAEDKE